jgi:hypothetical protein
MKLYTPEHTELIEVTTVEPFENGIQVDGMIMGAMPMKAVLRPSDLRHGMRFLTPRLVWTLFIMLFRKN